MAINIAYDPSDDPEAIAAREAEEADSIDAHLVLLLAIRAHERSALVERIILV